MKTLHRTVKRGVSNGEPVPSWPSFAARRMDFRRGSVAMIAGPPGSMKTTFALNTMRIMGPDVPQMYHSSDSDDFTMASRSLSMLTGDPTSESEIRVMAQEQAAYEALKGFENIRWSFSSGPSMDDLREEAEAFREIKGTYPWVTWVDILMNVNHEGVEMQNYWGVMAELNDMARDQQTAVIALHHTSESAKAGSPPPSAAIMGKANHLPTLIVTLWGDSAKERLDVAAVKNRFGPMDPLAKNFFPLKAQPGICLIEEPHEGDFKSAPYIFATEGFKDPEEQELF